MGGEFAAAIAATIGAAFGAWLLDRWLGVRARIGTWWRSVKARKSATEAMVQSWPTALQFIANAQERDEAQAAREVRVTCEMKLIREHLTRQDNTLELISAQLWGQMKLDPQARFQCDHHGSNEQVNAAYAKTMRVGEFDLLFFGWKNHILEEDRAEYDAAAAQAFREHRKFERTARFRRGDGTRFRGLVRIEPYPEDPSDLAEGRHPLWFGSLIAVEELA